MNFPHLNDNNFPHLKDVDVYSIENNFDYTRWTENSIVTLCNVLWDSNYVNTVKFDDNAARNSYFDNLPNVYKQVLSVNTRILPSGEVKIDIPFDVASKYNYLRISFPPATSMNNLLDYERTDGNLDWFFFIENVEYAAPSTSALIVSLDVWTTFINDVDLSYMVLERGHAPVAYSDTDNFLADPINNCEYLLAPDVNFGETDITSAARFVPFGNGKKYVCFILNTDIGDLFFGQVFSDNYIFSRPLRYSNVNIRQGYQLQVDNYGVGNGRNYSNVRTPVGYGINSSNNTVPNNVSCVAVDAVDCVGSGNFFEYMIENYPSFFNCVKAIFVADENMITVKTPVTIGEFSIFAVEEKQTTVDGITLTKEMFGYPEECERFAKLYTSPYAVLEVTDNNGKTVEIKTETVRNGNYIVCNFSGAYPFLNLRAFFVGIGTSGSFTTRYNWQKLDDTTVQQIIPNSNFFEYCFNFDIPTYAMFIDGLTNHLMRHYNKDVRGAGLAPLTSYHNNVRDANTARENAIAEINTAHKNAINQAKTNRINALNTAGLGLENAEQQIVVNNTNAANNINANDYINNVNEVQLSNQSMYGMYLANDVSGMAASYSVKMDNLTIQNIQVNSDITTQVATATNINSAVGNSLANATGTITGTAITGASLGAPIAGVGAVPGALIGAGVGVINVAASTLTNYSTAESNNVVISTGNQAQANQAIYMNSMSGQISRSRAYYTQYRNVQNTAYTDGLKVSAMEITTDVNNRLLDYNTYNQNDYIATVSTNTKNCLEANADNNRNMAVTNADNTANTRTDNTNHTRDNAIMNLKETLETSQFLAQAKLLDARNYEPVKIGEYTGDMAPDVYLYKGLQVKVKTQSKAHIKQASDYFARYGYALDRIWDVSESGLNLMSNFTFWKASDLWVDDRFSGMTLTKNTIYDIFTRGVTVWSNPTMIGKVGAYNNE